MAHLENLKTEYNEDFNHKIDQNDQIDAILFLGDMAYNLQTNQGETGNQFLEYIRDVTSKIPFQVFIYQIKSKLKI